MRPSSILIRNASVAPTLRMATMSPAVFFGFEPTYVEAASRGLPTEAVSGEGFDLARGGATGFGFAAARGGGWLPLDGGGGPTGAVTTTAFGFPLPWAGLLGAAFLPGIVSLTRRVTFVPPAAVATTRIVYRPGGSEATGTAK